eukprot:CAMPEP_0196719414 /NCGR_PEP_ID=MMETSP1091-20130531/2390_1 /TAXON_ID=302021 /ORGANISM="Rhodomonas sp., Strain CCMP768" /LENGTH=240 /DNA_ID=CAMNT_0042060351 /DNA_START=28 /DNA_END=750 /DNA_ORIENTATION=-
MASAYAYTSFEAHSPVHQVDDPEARVCVVCPRRKIKPGEESMAHSVNAKANAVALSLEFLQPYFKKPLTQVSEELGLSATAIKKACRKFGVSKWPYRTLTAKTSRNRAAVEEATRITRPSSWQSLQDSSSTPTEESMEEIDRVHYLSHAASWTPEEEFSRSSSSFPDDEFAVEGHNAFESTLDCPQAEEPAVVASKVHDDSWMDEHLAVPEHSIRKFLEGGDLLDGPVFDPFLVPAVVGS